MQERLRRRQRAAGARGTDFTGASIVLSPAEAEEYCVFKRKKRVDEVLAALKKTVILPPEDLSAAEISKCAEAARGVKALALRVPSNKVAAARNASAGGAAVDAIVGGNGETSWQVKRYEAKRALRDGAGRITLILSPSAVQTGKTGETKREIKKVCKAVKKRPVTVALPENVAARTDKAAWKKIAGLAADYGAKYLSVPFFAGAEELRTFLKDTCMLEVTGVQTAADFKTMIAAGAEIIADERGRVRKNPRGSFWRKRKIVRLRCLRQTVRFLRKRRGKRSKGKRRERKRKRRAPTPKNFRINRREKSS